MFSFKNFFRILIDLSLLVAAFVLATVVRIEGDFSGTVAAFLWKKQLFKVLPWAALVQFLSLFAFGTYNRFWRYTSVDDIIHLTRSLFVGALILVLPRTMGYQPQSGDIYALSLGVIVINFLIALGLLSAIRLLRSEIIERRKIKQRLKEVNAVQKRTLIIGAGTAGIEVAKAIKTHPELALKVVAMLDDDTKKHNMKPDGEIKVFGFIKDVQYWCDELNILQIIIAIPSLNLHDRTKLFRLCSETGLDVRTIPGVDQLAGGQVNVEQIRKLSMEDLLGREEVSLNTPDVIQFLKGKRVLVTGAGGSIGRELCLQLASQCSLSALCLLGKGENSIFQTMQDLNELDNLNELDIHKKIADIRNQDRIDQIFEEFKPDVVFHAAAHKHVHLMELNVCEAFENNVLGTKNIAELSGKHKVSAFVLVSTDKSVNPTSVMGATKNLAEKATLVCSRQYPDTKFTVVRFGNVLGSRGSVIQIWKQQLQKSLPLTVTHKDAIRYFMTIPEAAQLVIQGGAKANNGEIMVLDMGEPVNIYELAQQFIRLSGFSVDEVNIEIIGLKPGEKLYEELLTSDEFIDSKLTEKIYKAKISTKLSDIDFTNKLNELSRKASLNDVDSIKESVFKLTNPDLPINV